MLRSTPSPRNCLSIRSRLPVAVLVTVVFGLAHGTAWAQPEEAPEFLRACKPTAPAPLIVVECPQGFVLSVLPVKGGDAKKLLEQAREGNLKRVRATDGNPRVLERKSNIKGLDKEGVRLLWHHTEGELWFFDSFEGPDGIYQCGGKANAEREKECTQALTWVRKVGLGFAASRVGGRRGPGPGPAATAGPGGPATGPVGPAGAPAGPVIPLPDGCEKQAVRPPAHVWLCRDDQLTELTLLPLDESKQNANDAVDAMTPMASTTLKNQGWAMRNPEARDCIFQNKGVPCTHLYGKKASGAEAHMLLGAGQLEGTGPVLAMCKWGGLEADAPEICRSVLMLKGANGKAGKKGKRKRKKSKGKRGKK